jgi:hypothetical protein
MKMLQASEFKARCLGLLKEIRDTGEPLAVTLRGETLAVIHAPDADEPKLREPVASTLRRLRPLLLEEEEEFEPPVRTTRPAVLPF